MSNCNKCKGELPHPTAIRTTVNTKEGSWCPPCVDKFLNREARTE